MSVVTLSVNENERGTVTGGGTYDVGSQVTVTANNNSGYFFACWSDGSKVVSANPSYTFEVSGDITLTAYFYSDIDSVKIYGMCGANCKHQVLSIGQVISLIQEMAKNEFQVPTGFIPSTAVNLVVEQNKGKAISLFVGTQAEWNAWKGNKQNVIRILLDDPLTKETQEMLSKFPELSAYIDRIRTGVGKVKKAENADKVNNLDIKLDEANALKFDENIISYKKRLIGKKGQEIDTRKLSGGVNTIYQFDETESAANRTYEIYVENQCLRFYLTANKMIPLIFYGNQHGKIFAENNMLKILYEPAIDGAQYVNIVYEIIE